MAWDIWNLVKDTGIGKAIAKGVGKVWEFVKGVGKSVWSGIKSFFGIGEKVSKPLKGKKIEPPIEEKNLVKPLAVKEIANPPSEKENKSASKKEEIAKPVVEKTSIIHKVVEVAKAVSPIKEVETVRETQKVETVKEGSPPIEVKPNITFNVNLSSFEPQKVKEEILRTLERLTPDILEWLEKALNELRHRNTLVY